MKQQSWCWRQILHQLSGTAQQPSARFHHLLSEYMYMPQTTADPQQTMLQQTHCTLLEHQNSSSSGRWATSTDGPMRLAPVHILCRRYLSAEALTNSSVQPCSESKLSAITLISNLSSWRRTSASHADLAAIGVDRLVDTLQVFCAKLQAWSVKALQQACPDSSMSALQQQQLRQAAAHHGPYKMSHVSYCRCCSRRISSFQK